MGLFMAILDCALTRGLAGLQAGCEWISMGRDDIGELL